jgi:hypothetical protein
MAIQNFTDLDLYYGDDSQWGNHQYITIKDLVNDFMFSQTNDSHVANVDVDLVVYHAKRCVQELYFDVVNEVISIELDLNPSFIIPLPHDYISYVQISWVDLNGRKHPMAIDKRSNLAQAYLQDDNFDYIYDDDGDILQGSHSQDMLADDDTTNYLEAGTVSSERRSPDFNLDRSKVFKNGSYIIDKERGIIQFSSSVQGRTIVLDYISDGLFQRADSDIRIHKFAEEAAHEYIYWKLISKNKNVPRNEKEGARRDWFNARRIAKRRITPTRYEEIRQIMKGTSKMIKD